MKKVEIHPEFVEYGNVDELPDDDQRLVVEARLSVNKAYAPYSPGVKIKAVAITAQSDLFHIDKPITPCGACRQAIAEYEHRYHGPIRMIMVGETGKVLVADSISQFLPYQFTADDLNLKRT